MITQKDYDNLKYGDVLTVKYHTEKESPIPRVFIKFHPKSHNKFYSKSRLKGSATYNKNKIARVNYKAEVICKDCIVNSTCDKTKHILNCIAYYKE